MKEEAEQRAYNKLIHERSRLQILTKLAGTKSRQMSFSELKDALGFTAGNLSVHLKLLEEVKYLQLEKRFENNKPLTTVTATEAGIEALKHYLDEMEEIIRSMKDEIKDIK